MKLDKKIKAKIDEYFDNISSEDLYLLSKRKYFFKDDLGVEILNQNFTTIRLEKLISKSDESFSVNNIYSFPLAS